MNTILDAALAYAARGWPVHPIAPRGKHPTTDHGFKDATTDPAQIRAWFENSPRLNLGLATGRNAGVWVLDLDHGGAETLLDWERDHGCLPDTPLARTGGGGRHYFFRNPADLTIPSKVKFAPGTDTRGDGGYAILPPSVTQGPYTWLREGDPLEAPQWLLELVLGHGPDGAISEIEIEPTGLADAPGAPQGQRFAAACRLIGKELARGTDEAVILSEAIAWGRRCSPPAPDADIVRIFSELRQKDRAKPANAGTENLEDLALPPAEPWPTLPTIALRHGILGDLLDRLTPVTEADPVALLTTFLVAFGNAAGRGPGRAR